MKMENEDNKPLNIITKNDDDRVSMSRLYSDAGSTTSFVSEMRLDTLVATSADSVPLADLPEVGRMRLDTAQFAEKMERSLNGTVINTVFKQENFANQTNVKCEEDQRKSELIVSLSGTSFKNVTRPVNTDTHQENKTVVQNKPPKEAIQTESMLQSERNTSILSCKSTVLDHYNNFTSSGTAVVDGMSTRVPFEARDSTGLESLNGNHQDSLSQSSSFDSAHFGLNFGSPSMPNKTTNDNVKATSPSSALENETASFQTASSNSSFNFVSLQPAGISMDVTNLTSSAFLMAVERAVGEAAAHSKEASNTLSFSYQTMPSYNKSLHSSNNTSVYYSDDHTVKKEMGYNDLNENNATRPKAIVYESNCEYSDNSGKNIKNKNDGFEKSTASHSGSGNTSTGSQSVSSKSNGGSSSKDDTSKTHVNAPLSRKRKLVSQEYDGQSASSLKRQHITDITQEGSNKYCSSSKTALSNKDSNSTINVLDNTDQPCQPLNERNAHLQTSSASFHIKNLSTNETKSDYSSMLMQQTGHWRVSLERFETGTLVNTSAEHNGKIDSYEMYVTGAESGSKDEINLKCADVDTKTSTRRSCNRETGYSLDNSGDSDKEDDDFDDRPKNPSAKSGTCIACDVCPEFKAKNKTELLRHEITTLHYIRKFGYSALERKKRECNVCSARFANRTSLLYHYRNQHAKFVAEGDTLQCSLCNQYRKIKNHKEASSQNCHSLRFHYRSHMNRSYSIRDVTNNYCDICTKAFTSKEDLDEHLITHFENYNSICVLCNEDFHDRNILIQHIPSHFEAMIDQKPSKDDLAPSGDRQKANFQNEAHGNDIPIDKLPLTETWDIHKWNKNYPREATCKSCPNFKASSYSMMMLHEKMTFHIQKKIGKSWLEFYKYECAICSARYKKSLKLRQHFKRRHIEKKLDFSPRSLKSKIVTRKKKMKCHMCFENFTNENTYDDHIKSHFQMTSFKCELCKQEFMERKDLIEHLPVHDSPEIKCDLCDLYFSTEEEVRIHRAGYHKLPGEKQFPCVHCSKVFQTKKGVNLHMKHIHIQKIFKCEHCEQCFQNKDTLLTHTIYMHTKEYPFPCKMCEKGFRFEAFLNKHIEDHHAIDKILCTICDKKFTIKWQLERHMQEHEMEERQEHSKSVYVCEICGKKFLKRMYLKGHLKVHAGTKTFHCEICNRYFGRVDNLRTHMRTHTGQKPYCCEECGKQFARKDNLNTHKRKMHNSDA